MARGASGTPACMVNDLIEPHQATGALELIAVRYADRTDSIGVAALRWRDEGSGRFGESSRSRLVLGLDRRELEVFVRHDDTRVPVEVVPAADGGGAILRAIAAEDADLVL